MKNRLTKATPLLLISIVLIAALSGYSQSTQMPSATTRNITDMYGTNLTVPVVINRVLSTGPVETQLIYMLAPDKLCAVNGIGDSSFWDSSWNGTPPFVPEEHINIPNIGSGSSGTLSFEAAIATDPDIVLEGKTKNLANYREHFGSIPVVGVDAGASLVWDYEAEIGYVGDLLEVSDKADELIAFYQEAMDYVDSKVGSFRSNNISAPDDPAMVRVYYAEGTDGLQTDAKGSWHTNLLWYCGGANVADVGAQNTSGTVTVSMEDILGWEDESPIDMIIIGRGSQTTTFDAIVDPESLWQSLDCVQRGAVYIRPDNPTSWFDGPPGYGQIIGMYWMVHLLYPELTTDLDLSAKIKEFYSKFLHYELTDSEVDILLSQPIP
jgi:iron complex transport system substrate-binding protein